MKLKLELTSREKEQVRNLMELCNIPNTDLIDHKIHSSCGSKTSVNLDGQKNTIEVNIHSDITIMFMARFNKAIKSIIDIAKGFMNMFESIDDMLQGEETKTLIDDMPEEEYFNKKDEYSEKSE
jgi:hypothetical protein